MLGANNGLSANYVANATTFYDKRSGRISMKTRSFLVTVLICGICGPAPCQRTDQRLMSDSEYTASLSKISVIVPRWESALKEIDLTKTPQISYASGKSIANERDMGLLEVANIKYELTRLRAKRTVSGELALHGFLDSLFNIGLSIVWDEDFANVTLTHLEELAPELSKLDERIGNDVFARVDLLEKGMCQ